MKGYKVFNPNWTCRDFQYEVGQTYEIDGELMICSRGFHFCENLIDCFNYYGFNPQNKVAEIEALGDIVSEGNKNATNKIKIVREMTWEEVLGKANIGENNTGKGNIGNFNSGWYNSGWYNSGDSNSGNFNSGWYNSGDNNSGSNNFGKKNSGYENVGNYNSGSYNVGFCNSGDFNLCDCSNGVFNTQEPKINIFNKPSNLTLSEWRQSKAFYLLYNIKTHCWIYSENMSEKEKSDHPKHKIAGGYLKVVSLHEAATEWWQRLEEEEKEIVKNIPNFDAEIFRQTLGIDINATTATQSGENNSGI